MQIYYFNNNDHIYISMLYLVLRYVIGMRVFSYILFNIFCGWNVELALLDFGILVCMNDLNCKI